MGKKNLLGALGRWGWGGAPYSSIEINPTIPSDFVLGDHGAPVVGSIPALEVVDVVGSEDQQECDRGDGYFAYGSYDEGAGALFEEVFEVGAEAYSGEG
jgi:hypothetical protein